MQIACQERRLSSMIKRLHVALACSLIIGGPLAVRNKSFTFSAQLSSLNPCAASTSNPHTDAHTIARISIIARLRPAHTCWPAENGMNAARFVTTCSLHTISPDGTVYLSCASHRSGQYSSWRGGEIAVRAIECVVVHGHLCALGFKAGTALLSAPAKLVRGVNQKRTSLRSWKLLVPSRYGISAFRDGSNGSSPCGKCSSISSRSRL